MLRTDAARTTSRPVRRRRHAGATVILACSLAAALAVGCGGDGDDAAAATTATPATLDAATATTAVPAPTAPASTTVDTSPGAVLTAAIDYVIVEGDFPSTIADRYSIPLQALLDENGWELVEQQVPMFPLPGTTIRIPAGAVVPAETPASSTPGDPAEATGTTEPEDGVCGTYVIMEGDNPSVVARKLDTTVDKLDAVNADTAGYGGFILGLTINVPC